MKNNILLFAFILSLLMYTSCKPSDSGKDYGLQVSTLVKINEPIIITMGDSSSFRAVENAESIIKKHTKITPSTDFDVEIMNSQTLSLKPQKPLKYKTTYKLSLNIGKITGSGSDVRDFEIKTLSPILKYTDGTLSVSDNSEDKYYISGSIDVSESVDPKYIESGFSVGHSGCVVTWTHSADAKSHQYKIENILAEEQSYQLVIKRDYTQFDDRENFEVSYRIPAKGEICVVDAAIINEPYHYEIVFSSVLNTKQSFNDLVSVPGGGKIRFLAEENKLLVYPGIKAAKNQKIIISKLIKNNKNRGLDEDWSKIFEIPSNVPSVKFVSKGVILPSSNDMNIQFQSINYAKVRVRARRIYESNILQYFQDNSLNSKESYTVNVSRIIIDSTIVLGEPSSDKLRNNTIYGLNLTDLINPQKGAIYKIEIRGIEPLVTNDDDDYYESDYYFGSYSDYSDRVAHILSSDLGVIVKGSDAGQYTFVVTDLITTNPISSANVKVYNNVNQLIGEGSTNSDGVVTIALEDSPLTAIVSSGKDKNYVKLVNGNSLSLSNFEVGGTAVKGGQKGFIFGERGVWRPGDDIYITFISMMADGTLPANHPVTAVLNNPQGQTVRTLVNNNGSNGLYTFKFGTESNAPTGNWEVVVTAGGQKYTKQIKIETVKPNKLLINLSLNDKPIIPANLIRGDLSVKWLVGNPAANLQAKIEVALRSGNTSFPKYKDYVFEDISRSFTSETKELVKGVTDMNGDFSFNVALDKSREIPGFMKAVFTTRVFEKSGDFSIDSYQANISPFETYIGLNVPEKENLWGEKYLDKNTTHTVKLVALNATGGTTSNRVPLRVEIYNMGWSWWWGSSFDGLASYSQDSYNKPLKTFNTNIVNGSGHFELDLQNEDSGFYFIRVVDINGGHATSKVVLSSYSYDGGSGSGQTAAAKLSTSLDKEKYKVGETANITIPSALGAKALVSIEKGESVLHTFWVDCKGSNTTIPIKLDDKMIPNVYATITLIQPHNQKQNDAPIRLFGVQRIDIEDDATHLVPTIIINDEIKPETDVTLTIKEKNSAEMSYVIAIVDEGLLSLTKYKTPNPWDAFYATEALAVRTWDIYDLVIGAYGARMEQLFAIGGDGENLLQTANSKVERFKPVSIFMGPFTLKARGKDTHTITIPQYIGNLRVMVIATNGKAQGSAEKNVIVKKAVMVQTTMPRVIGTDEEVVVPVTVFTNQKNVGKVSVKIETNEYLKVMDNNTQEVTINDMGEQLVYFRLKASDIEGVGEITTTAKSSSDNSRENISIEVRNPNPQTTISRTEYLKKGESKSLKMNLIGTTTGTTAKVEASTLPPIDLDFRLKYLTGYQHGCLEQTISSVFPQLYLGKIKTLSNEEAQNCEKNIKAALAKLPFFAVNGGGFTYWPGSAYSSISFWGTAYAAHFMIEAQNKGYAVPSDLKKSTLKYLSSRVSTNDFSLVERAYTCYVLALAGDAPRGTMNKLREEISNIPVSAGWFLAAAYAYDNKKDVAHNIIDKVTKKGEYTANPFSSSFDSDERLIATTILTYNKLGEQSKSFKSVETLSKLLNDRNNYMSTQSTAWALNAISDYCGNSAQGGVDVAFKADNHKISLTDDKSFVNADIPVGKDKTISVEMTNKSDSPAYVILSSTGIPEKGEEIAHSNGLKMVINYLSSDGSTINPSDLEQGTDFTISAYILNTSTTVDYTNLVLSQIFPSGWEIRNDRSEYFYQDFRDDRVYSYFNLKRSSSVTIKVKATATYKGKFYLPSTICEAMYDASVNASSVGGWCVVR